jgi:hypothetical protein
MLPIEIPPQEMARIDDTKEIINVKGTIFFNNGFEEKPIEQPVCFSFFSYVLKSKTGAIKGGPYRMFVPCDQLEDVLQGALDQKKEAAQKD